MTTTDNVTNTAQVIEDKPNGQSGHRQKSGTVSGQGRVVGVWANTDEAAMRLGVSERTIRRRAKSGQLPTRVWGGRRQVRLDPPDVSDTMTDTPDAVTDEQAAQGGQPGHRHLSGTVSGTGAAELAMLTREVIELRTTETRRELTRARRWAGFGLTAAAALVIVGAAGGVYAVRAIEQAHAAAGIAEAQATAAELTRAAEADLRAAERARADRLADELIDAQAAARAAEAQLHAAQVETMLLRTMPDSWATVPTEGSIIRID